MLIKLDTTKKFLSKDQDEKLFQKVVKVTNMGRFHVQQNVDVGENVSRLTEFIF